jgi:hypothetical protein
MHGFEEEEGDELKKCPGFINYKTQNFCRSCQLRVSKKLYPKRCPECNRLLKTKQRNKIRHNKGYDARPRVD